MIDLLWISRIASILSILGSIWLMGSYILFADLRTRGRLLLFFLSTMDFLMALGILLPNTSPIWCNIQGYLGVFSCCSAFLWSGCISVYVYLSLCTQLTVNYEEYLEFILHFISWGYPFAMIILCYFYATFSPTNEPWCYITGNHANWLRMTTTYGPIWMSLSVSMICYLIIWLNFWYQTDEITNDVEAMKTMKRLTFVPLVFVLLRTPGTLNRILEMLGPDYKLGYWADVLQATCDPSQGLVNAIFYSLLSTRIRKRYIRFLLDIFCKCSIFYKCSNFIDQSSVITFSAQKGSFTTPHLYYKTYTTSFSGRVPLHKSQLITDGFDEEAYYDHENSLVVNQANSSMSCPPELVVTTFGQRTESSSSYPSEL